METVADGHGENRVEAFELVGLRISLGKQYCFRSFSTSSKVIVEMVLDRPGGNIVGALELVSRPVRITPQKEVPTSSKPRESAKKMIPQNLVV